MGLILSTILPQLQRDLASLCGVGLVSYDAWLVYPPAGFIVAGSLMIACALLLALGSRPAGRCGPFRPLASGLRRPKTKAADVSGPDWSSLFALPNALSGVWVNVDSAPKVSTVFPCLRVLADGIAQVP